MKFMLSMLLEIKQSVEDIALPVLPIVSASLMIPRNYFINNDLPFNILWESEHGYSSWITCVSIAVYTCAYGSIIPFPFVFF